MPNTPKYNFGEIVRVLKQREPVKRNVANLEGYISGRAQNDNGFWSYAVFLYELEHNWSFDEDMLETTGKFDDSLSQHGSIRIRMEGQQGVVVPSDDDDIED